MSLSSSRPAFASLLGVFGRGVTQVGGGTERRRSTHLVSPPRPDPWALARLLTCGLWSVHMPSQGCGDDGGADVVYATHVDGSLSIWLRMPGRPTNRRAPGRLICSSPANHQGSLLHLCLLLGPVPQASCATRPAAGLGSCLLLPGAHPARPCCWWPVPWWVTHGMTRMACSRANAEECCGDLYVTSKPF